MSLVVLLVGCAASLIGGHWWQRWYMRRNRFKEAADVWLGRVVAGQLVALVILAEFLPKSTAGFNFLLLALMVAIVTRLLITYEVLKRPEEKKTRE